MTLDQYKVEINKMLDNLDEIDKNHDYDGYLESLNKLSETISHAMKKYDDNSLVVLDKYIIFTIRLFELAIDCDVITLKS